LSESGLSIGFPDLKSEVGFHLGYGRGVVKAWSADELSEIEVIVHSGVRRVYYPPAVSDQLAGYDWSWLKPTTTLSIQGKYNIGTVTVASGVVTLTAAGTFPSWAASAEFLVDGTWYTVDTRDGDNQITLDDTSVDADALSTYSLNQIYYDLPDDFGRFASTLHYEPDQYRSSIQIIAVSQLLQMRSSTNLTGNPKYAAVRFKSATPAAIGSRQEVLFFPIPDESHTLFYEYEAYSGALTDSLPYPLGGMQMAELYIASCLAVAESRLDDAPGVHNADFSRLLVDAIVRDRKRGAKVFGQMGHKERLGGYDYMFRRGWTGGTYPISYKGESI
jgi:hypothetical protein